MSNLYTPYTEADLSSLWASYQEARLGILGSGAVLLNNLVGPHKGSTFLTLGDIEATFTQQHSSNPPVSMQGICPVATLDGTTQYWTSPDANYWSFGADSTAPNEPIFSLGGYIKINTAQLGGVLTKRDSYPSNAEYNWSVLATGAIRFNLIDSGASAFIGRDTPIQSLGVWLHVVITYDGSAVNSGVRIYVNGVQVDNADSSTGSYTAMHNTTSQIRLGLLETFYFNGSIAFSPAACPFVTNIELTAAQVKRDYLLGKAAMGLL